MGACIRKVCGSRKGVNVMEACIKKVCGSRKGVNVMEACIKKVCGSRKGVNVMEACVRKVCGSRKGVNVIETCIRKAMCNFNTHFCNVPDLGKVRKWLEASNKIGKTVGVRWLRQKARLVEEGKKTSSVVVYLEKSIEVEKVRLGGRWMRVDQYEWDRGRK
ncbi:hypothetical protein BDZ91DRAFT_837669 [Kalaharituber pfeilii]|nr:hypothetical protein BDZ91DRAFT_837669 [Kalaharituber pfeilii]